MNRLTKIKWLMLKTIKPPHLTVNGHVGNEVEGRFLRGGLLFLFLAVIGDWLLLLRRLDHYPLPFGKVILREVDIVDIHLPITRK